MIDKADFERRLREDRDFIALKRFDYSLVNLRKKYPDGCPDHVIASALQVPEDEVEALYQSAVARLRGALGVAEPVAHGSA